MSGSSGAAPARPRDIWTRLAVDPLADPLARWLARHRVVTPNRVTGVSGALGVAAAVCLATGRLREGGVLFLLRFFADCVDGKVARLQGTGSARGAVFDVGTDVVCVVGAYAALAYWATREGHVGPAWSAALLVSLGWYGWALAHRKHLASLAGRGDGGSRLHERRDVPVLGGWLGLCRRLGMSPVPWAVEVETVVLGLLPVLGPRWAPQGVYLACAFYLVATTVNFARLARLAALMDQSRASVGGASR